MQALAHEVELAFEAFVFQRMGESGTASIVSSSSSSGGNCNGHKHRRAVRQLQRSLSKMEAYAFHEEAQHTAIDEEILEEATHVLVDIVTVDESLRILSDHHDWMGQEVVQLYEQGCVIAVHLLSLTGLHDTHAVALLDRVSEEIFKQSAPPYSPLLVSLMQLLHNHLQLFPNLPLLSTKDSIWLVSLATTRCIRDLRARVVDDGPFAMRCFLAHFLRHIASLKDDHESMREWHEKVLLEFGTEDASRQSVSFFCNVISLGEETLESVLDLVADKADAASIIHQAASALTMVDILENGFSLSFEENLRSLFVGLVNFIVQQPHDQGYDLILPLARKILPTVARNDKPVHQAAAMALYLALGHEGLTDEADFLVKFCSECVPSALLTSLLLPTAGDTKEMCKRLVTVCPVDSPWNYIIARKIPITGHPVDVADRALQIYAHQYTGDSGQN
jgi:hypothetical protein